MDELLIVEADAATREVIERTLVDYELLWASNRVAAVSLLKQRRPSLIFVNIDLPGIDEKWVFKIAQHDRYKDIPIVIISNRPDEASSNTVLWESGASDILQQPLSSTKLREVVERQSKEAQRANRRTSDRYKVKWQADYHVLEAQTVMNPRGHRTIATNISEGGAAFLPSGDVAVDQLCAIALHVDGHVKPYLVIGQICWTTHVRNTRVAGVKWVLWESEREKDAALSAALSLANVTYI